MERLIYGVFPNRDLAENAQKSIHDRALNFEYISESATAAIHEHEIRPNDLPRSGNFAKRSALVGGVFVGGCVGVMLGLLMGGVFAGIGGPETILGSDPIDVVLVTIAAGTFGAVLTGIAGTAGKRSQLRDLEGEVEAGRVVLTLEAPKSEVRAIARTMSVCGAIRTGSI